MRKIIVSLFIIAYLIFPTVRAQQGLTMEEVNDPRFDDSLDIMVVRFDSFDKKTQIFAGQFPSTGLNARYSFKLLSNERTRFFKYISSKNKAWQEEITQKEFTKIFKHDIWFVIYRISDNDRIVYVAHQAKSLKSFSTAFAEDPENFYQSPQNLEFWQAMKVKRVACYHFDKSSGKAYWYFLKIIKREEPRIKSDDEWVQLKGDFIIKVRLPMGNDMDGRVVENENGVLIINSHTVFSGDKVIISADNPTRRKNVPVDMDLQYFEANFNKTFWLFFYNKESLVVLRVVTGLGEEMEVKKEDKK